MYCKDHGKRGPDNQGLAVNITRRRPLGSTFLSLIDKNVNQSFLVLYRYIHRIHTYVGFFYLKKSCSLSQLYTYIVSPKKKRKKGRCQAAFKAFSNSVEKTEDDDDDGGRVETVGGQASSSSTRASSCSKGPQRRHCDDKDCPRCPPTSSIW